MGLSDGPRRVRVLFVCTGNVCRSPFAAALLQHRLDDVRPGRFDVTSAGTSALVGADMDEGSRAELVVRGVPARDFEARQVTAEMLRRTDLVITVTTAHREHLVELFPMAAPRVASFGRLVAGLGVAERRAAWDDAVAGRGVSEIHTRWRLLPQVVEMHAPRLSWKRVADVSDPYRRGPRAFRRMAETIETGVDALARWEARFPS